MKFFQGEKWLVMTGLLGFALAGICAIWVLTVGGAVAPDGNVAKAFSFNAALGIFLLSTAAILPFSTMGNRSKAFFRWTMIIVALYAYFAETVQHFRGVNPRFPVDGSAFDNTVGSLFAFDALLLLLFNVFLAVQYYRKRAYRQSPAMVLGIRYAMAAVMISFAAGIWISINQGIAVGAEGNLIWLHGLGFHALQALPFVAWLSGRKIEGPVTRHSLIHSTGFAYLLGLAAMGWQTYLGKSVYDGSALSLVALGCFLISLAPVAALLLRSSKRIETADHTVHR